MQIGLRILLIVGAICMLCFVLKRIRCSQLQTNDAVFWFIFAGCLVVISVFPQIIYWLCALLGIESPANLVFLLVIAIVIVKLLAVSVELAQTRNKVNRLVQHVALHEKSEIE